MPTKTCPWCAEEIAEAALKCRYCGSRVSGGLRDPVEWHRGYPERKLAGVCASVAHNLRVSVTATRAVFILLAFFHLFGVALYAILWFVLPEEPGGRTGLDRVIEAGRAIAGIDTPAQRRNGAAYDDARGSGDGAASEERSDGWSRTRS